MSQPPKHWYDRAKGEGVKAFEAAKTRQEPVPETIARSERQPRPPQPMLTPTGPMRDAVDRAVAEARDAEIAKRAEALGKKFEADRQRDRGPTL